MPRRDPITPPDINDAAETGISAIDLYNTMQDAITQGMRPLVADRSPGQAQSFASTSGYNPARGYQNWGANAENISASAAAVNSIRVPQGQMQTSYDNLGGLTSLNNSLSATARQILNFGSTLQSVSVDAADTGTSITNSRQQSIPVPSEPSSIYQSAVQPGPRERYIAPLSPTSVSPQIEQIKGIIQGLDDTLLIRSGKGNQTRDPNEYPVHGQSIYAGRSIGSQFTTEQIDSSQGAMSGTFRHLAKKGMIADDLINIRYSRAKLKNQYDAGVVSSEDYGVMDQSLSFAASRDASKISKYATSSINDLARGYQTNALHYSPTMTATAGMNGEFGTQVRSTKLNDVMGSYLQGVSQRIQDADKHLVSRNLQKTAAYDVRDKARSIEENIGSTLSKNSVVSELRNMGIDTSGFSDLSKLNDKRSAARTTAENAQDKLQEARARQAADPNRNNAIKEKQANIEFENAANAKVKADEAFTNKLNPILQQLTAANPNLKGSSSDVREMFRELLTSSGLRRQSEVIEGKRGLTSAEKLVERAKGVKNNASQFASMSLMNMQFGLMMGISGQLTQSMTQIPMQATYETVQPVYSSLGNISGLQGVFREFQQFGSQAPAIMSDLQGRTNSISSLLGTSYSGQAAVGKALDISKTQPVQFAEAMEVISAMATYPSTRAVAQKPEFQSKMFETVQLLSMLAPEQGTGGALFALREMMGGQMRSLQMRFNISPDLLASYAGITNQELKGASGEKLIGYMHSALTGLFGGNEILLKKGAQTDVQLNNIGDTLTAAIVKPLVMDTNTQFTGMLSSLLNNKDNSGLDAAINRDLGSLGQLLPESQAKMLQFTALERAGSETGVKIKSGDTLTSILKKLSPEQGDSFQKSYTGQISQMTNTLYGTTNGMLALLVTSLNSALDPLMQSFGVSGGISGIIGDFATPFINDVKTFQEGTAATTDAGKRKKLGATFIENLIDDINDAIDGASNKMNKGALNDIIGQVTDVARKAAEFTFQPVARTIMVQTAKTAVDIPGMVIGGTANAMTTGAADIITSLGSDDARKTTQQKFEKSVTWGQSATKMALGAAGWFAITQARKNPLGALSKFAAMGIASDAVGRMGNNPTGALVGFGETAAILAAPSIGTAAWEKIQKKYDMSYRKGHMSRLYDYGTSSTSKSRGRILSGASAALSSTTGKYILRGAGAAGLAYTAYEGYQLGKRHEDQSTVKNIGASALLLGQGIVASSAFMGPSAPIAAGVGGLIMAGGAITSAFAPQKDAQIQSDALKTTYETYVKRPYDDSVQNANRKWGQFSKKYGVGDIDIANIYQENLKKYGANDIRTIQSKDNFLKTDLGKYTTYVDTREQYKKAQSNYAKDPNKTNLENVQQAKANYQFGKSLYDTLTKIPESTNYSPEKKKELAESSALIKAAIITKESEPFKVSMSLYDSISKEGKIGKFKDDDRIGFAKDWGTKILPLIDAAVSSDKYVEKDKYGRGIGFDKSAATKDVSTLLQSVLLGKNVSTKEQSGLVEKIVAAIVEGYSKVNEAKDAASKPYTKNWAQSVNKKAYEQLFYEQYRAVEISPDVFKDPTQEPERLRKTQEWWQKDVSMVTSTAKSSKDMGKLVGWGLKGSELIGYQKVLGAEYNKRAEQGLLTYDEINGPQAAEIHKLRMMAGAKITDIQRTDGPKIKEYAKAGITGLVKQREIAERFGINDKGSSGTDNFGQKLSDVGKVAVTAAGGIDALTKAIAKLVVAAGIKPKNDPDAPEQDNIEPSIEQNVIPKPKDIKKVQDTTNAILFKKALKAENRSNISQDNKTISYSDIMKGGIMGHSTMNLGPSTRVLLPPTASKEVSAMDIAKNNGALSISLPESNQDQKIIPDPNLPKIGEAEQYSIKSIEKFSIQDSELSKYMDSTIPPTKEEGGAALLQPNTVEIRTNGTMNVNGG